jgi:hypothetical protein
MHVPFHRAQQVTQHLAQLILVLRFLDLAGGNEIPRLSVQDLPLVGGNRRQGLV